MNPYIRGEYRPCIQTSFHAPRILRGGVENRNRGRENRVICPSKPLTGALTGEQHPEIAPESVQNLPGIPVFPGLDGLKACFWLTLVDQK